MKHSRLLQPSAGFAVAALALTALLAGCGHKAERGVSPQSRLPVSSVRVETTQSRAHMVTEEVVGTVRAKLHATLEAKVIGRIEKMPVLLGQRVKAGELVAQLDAPEIKARLDQARATAEQAERDWKRVSALFGGQAATRAEYDAADARQAVATAAVAEAQAMLAYVEVPAPFDGVVTKKWADVGDLAAPGKPLIDIESPTGLQLEADVPDGIASRVRLADQMQVRLDSSANLLVGTVREIAPIADPMSRTFRVKLDLPQTPGLMSGQFARLAVPIGESASIWVPASAVVHRGQLEIVFTVVEHHAQLRLVKTGKQRDEQTEILSGLDAGETVVTDGASLLNDGQPVEVK